MIAYDFLLRALEVLRKTQQFLLGIRKSSMEFIAVKKELIYSESFPELNKPICLL